MKSSNKLYSIIGATAMILTPLSASITFGWRVFSEVNTSTEHLWLAIPAGVGAAIGLEAVGIYAGHVTSEFYHAGDRRWLATAVIMLAYVGIGVAELWDTVGATIFIISPLVYTLVALKNTATNEAAEAADIQKAAAARKDEKEDDEISRRRRVEDAERLHRQQIERQQLGQSHAAKMARIEAKRKAEVPEIKTEVPAIVPVAETDVSKNGTSNRQRAELIISTSPSISGAELGRQLGVSGRQGRNLKKAYSANGSVK